MKALEEVFHETMPREMASIISACHTSKAAAEGIPPSVIFGFSLLMVLLILAAQDESCSLPFSVLLGTPIAVMGAFAGLWLLRLENNIYAQIGLVMLIGLAAKNAILIVEFARMEHERGRDLAEAALAAARLRLRPILMTAFAFIMGVIPLVVAQGSRHCARILGRRWRAVCWRLRDHDLPDPVFFCVWNVGAGAVSRRGVGAVPALEGVARDETLPLQRMVGAAAPAGGCMVGHDTAPGVGVPTSFRDERSSTFRWPNWLGGPLSGCNPARSHPGGADE
jgi:hypothetical protein